MFVVALLISLSFPSLSFAQVTRALGDAAIPMCVPEPRVHVCSVEEGDVLVLGCDGVFDEVSEEMIAALVARRPESQQCALLIRDEAFFLGSTDNISVLCVKF